MNNGLYEDLSACFAALINVLEKHGVPRAEIAEAFQERFLTLQSLHPEDAEDRLVLLHGIATQAETRGRD